jgi:NADH-quinone oxidoreductase subunit M
VPGGLPTPTPTPGGTLFGANVIGFSFLLTTLLWLPVIFAIAIAIYPDPRGRYRSQFLVAAFFANFANLWLALIAYFQFALFTGGFQFEERLPWLPAFGITYHLGLDGLGMAYLLLATLVGMASVLASAHLRERVREYLCLLLVAQASVNGVIFARDLFVLVLFWGAGLVPLVVLVRGWGGPQRARAAQRLLVYGTVGTLLLLAAGLFLYASAGGGSFDLDYLLKASPPPRLAVAGGVLVILAAATRLPLVPFQGWVRDTLSEAPPGVAITVAGAFLPLGGYLLLRVLIAGDHDGSRLLAPFLALLGGGTCAWCGLKAVTSSEIRRIAAYIAMVPSGVTAVGAAGLTALSENGAALELLSGGLAAALVVAAAWTLGQRAPAGTLDAAAGIGLRAPRLGWGVVLAGLAVIGVPGFASFLAELMALFGAFRTQPVAAFTALAGILLTAWAVALLVHRVAFGAPGPDLPARLPDATLSEFWALALLVGALLWFGLVPSGPKLGGLPLFDPGIVNVVNGAVGDIVSPYVGAGG